MVELCPFADVAVIFDRYNAGRSSGGLAVIYRPCIYNGVTVESDPVIDEIFLSSIIFIVGAISISREHFLNSNLFQLKWHVAFTLFPALITPGGIQIIWLQGEQADV